MQTSHKENRLINRVDRKRNEKRTDQPSKENGTEEGEPAMQRDRKTARLQDCETVRKE
jgi:hypothetical protein